MSIKRTLSGIIATMLIVSASSPFASASPNAKPSEIGFEIGRERQDSDCFDFLDRPYSLTSGDYYMGITIQSGYPGTYVYRGNIGADDEPGTTIMNVNKQIVRGINAYCPWSHLYISKYAIINKDENGTELNKSISVLGPAGIITKNTEGKDEITEHTKIHDAKITGNGTYTVGIQGFNFKAANINNYGINDGDPGNGLTMLCLSSNFQYLYGKGVTISNPVLKLYNTKEEYEKKTPYKSIPAEYWITGLNNDTNNIQYVFTSKWAENGNYSEYGTGILNFDKKYQDNIGSLDVFGVSSYTGETSTKYKSGYDGCKFLPEYALEITFDVNMPPEYTATEQTFSSKKNIQTTQSPVSAMKNSTKATPTIKTKKAVIKKLTATKKKTLKITWKKVSGAKGYEIRLATNRKFTKNKRTLKVKKGSSTSKVIKKLKRGKRYYVKLRAYKNVKVDGYTVTANGPWSNIKRSKKIK